eukprot:TRINITY_DN6228_c0_g1_i1.p2 TRINITY_DN6228_c0_g1~~TRINITY_DN6228_c0_g1_i1.p2  ORF type:complete len:143 (-),score=17.91 TRINITY_DN6228_c0_g1_i1:265-693(-)
MDAPPSVSVSTTEGATGAAEELPYVRRKVPVGTGSSHGEWMRMQQSDMDLSGTGGRVINVTKAELRRHNKPDDLWMVLNGRVYNVTQYVRFHPGGLDELMKGAGKDGTSLFNKKHPWVNFNYILAKCFVGPYVGDAGDAPSQ